MNRKFLQFTIGESLEKVLISANAEYFIKVSDSTFLSIVLLGGASLSSVINITFQYEDESYKSHYAIIDALALANSTASNPSIIISPDLPNVGKDKQIIKSVDIK